MNKNIADGIIFTVPIVQQVCTISQFSGITKERINNSTDDAVPKNNDIANS